MDEVEALAFGIGLDCGGGIRAPAPAVVRSGVGVEGVGVAGTEFVDGAGVVVPFHVLTPP